MRSLERLAKLLAVAFIVAAVVAVSHGGDSGAWAAPINTALLIVLTVVTYKIRAGAKSKARRLPDEAAEKTLDKLADGGADLLANAIAQELDKRGLGGRREIGRRAED